MGEADEVKDESDLTPETLAEAIVERANKRENIVGCGCNSHSRPIVKKKDSSFCLVVMVVMVDWLECFVKCENFERDQMCAHLSIIRSENEIFFWVCCHHQKKKVIATI